jgi:ADP-ribosyl-[dinitrogen reductase] hydrolase
MNTSDRVMGVLLGLACGDALGRPVESNSAEQIRDTHGRVTELLAHGTHNQPADTVTDDTLLAKAQTAANGEKFTQLWRGSTAGYPG